MSHQLVFLGGLFIGSIAGFAICSIFASGKIEDAFREGFNRGKSTTTNIIK